MGKHSEILSKYITLLFQVLVLLGLYLISLYNYLLFHSLAELFSIVVGSSIFIIAWKSQQRLDNHYFLVVGIACLFVSGLDLLHTLAYKGMGVFPGEGSNLPTQLWIVARYIQSLSLLFALLFLRRKLNAYAAFLCYTVVTALLLVAVFSDILAGGFLRYGRKVQECNSGDEAVKFLEQTMNCGEFKMPFAPDFAFFDIPFSVEYRQNGKGKFVHLICGGGKPTFIMAGYDLFIRESVS